jgi:CubicO group peptidase (beta-lactamase class C family)
VPGPPRAGARPGPRTRIGLLTALLALATSTTFLAVPPASAQTAPTRAQQAVALTAIARNALTSLHLNAVIYRVTVNGRPVVTGAVGYSTTGIPATPAMHFPNGAVSFYYLSTLMMEYVDAGKISLNDPIGKWMPNLPEANQVTLKMLANNTSGYPDFETNPTFIAQQYANPFRFWSYDQRLALTFDQPILYKPGTNWSYSHTNTMILGAILAQVGGKPLATLLRQKVLNPMGLHNTVANPTAFIPSPVLRAFDSERRVALGIPPTTPFYEETTSWTSQWGTPPGGTQTTNIYDEATTAQEVGSGALLSKSSYQAMTGPNLLGFGQTTAQCPTCHKQINVYNYGLGLVRSGSWLVQNPLLDGYASVAADLPSKKIAIAVSVTFGPGAFDSQGNYPNSSDTIFRQMGAYMAPGEAPPTS